MSVNTHCHQTPIMFGTRDNGRSRPRRPLPQRRPGEEHAPQPTSMRTNRTGGPSW